MIHFYNKCKFQPFTETFSLLPHSLCSMTCLHSYALPHLMLGNTLLVEHQQWFCALYCHHYERCNVMDTFLSAPGQDDCVNVMLEAVFKHCVLSTDKFMLPDCPCLLGNSDNLLWLVVFLYGTWSQGLQSLPLKGLLSHMYVWLVWRFWISGGLGWAFGRDRGHIHQFLGNFILQSQHFFETWKIRVGCCLNATNFSAYNVLWYL